MSILVLAEHDNATLATSTLNAITAAHAIGDDIHVLVAGHGCAPVAEAAARVEGVTKVRVADDPRYEHALAEPLAALLASIGHEHGHILAPVEENYCSGS